MKKPISILLLFILCIMGIKGMCQVQWNESKFSPVLFNNYNKKVAQVTSHYFITVTDVEAFEQWFVKQNLTAQKLYFYAPSKTFLIEVKWKDILQHISKCSLVVFIDEKRTPKEELVINGFDISTNKINTIHNEFPQYNGTGVKVSVKENKMDTTDIDFTGRYIPTPVAATMVTGHASIMTTMIAGAGNTYYQGKGAAWGAGISSSNFATLLPDADAIYQQYDITVQNHSYGTGIENFYGADAASYDASMVNNPSLSHNFSAGNSGSSAAGTGLYAGIAGYANITGSFKMGKNIITAGATDSFGNVAALSSKGPAYDGRVKPELVAFGEDGSSGAAALVSGTCLMLQQAYKQTHNNILPPSALIKSLLINSADDVDAKGIDFKSGYGSLNAYKAMKGLLAERHFTRSVIQGGNQTFNLTLPAGIKRLKITLAWNDPAAQPNAAKALVNDLDLELSNNGQIWKPWVLNHYPNKDSLAQPATRKRDSLNNVEQITIDSPAPGNYEAKVLGFKVTTPLQNFSISWQADSADTFKWHYPTSNDNLVPGTENTLRWTSDFNVATGQLEYSFNGNIWQPINTSADLGKGYFKWLVPDTFSIGFLRMRVGSKIVLSDSFTISKRINTSVGFNCTDSFLFYWPKIPDINNYRIYSLAGSFLKPLLVVSDTAVILGKNTNTSLHYAVAPVIGNTTGVKSFTFNYATQGIGCYIKSFFAQLNNNSVQLDALLGSNYHIKKIEWQKLSNLNFNTLLTVMPVNGLQFSYTDMAPHKGVNIYRLKIELINGQVIYSPEERVNYLSNDDFILFPNPASLSQNISIILKDAANTTVQVFNSIGIKMMEKKSNDVLISFSSARWSKGLYFLRIIQNNNVKKTLRLMVY